MVGPTADNGSDRLSTPLSLDAAGQSGPNLSDKENCGSPSTSRTERRKQATRTGPSSNALSEMGDASNKRRRAAERDVEDIHEIHKRKLREVHDTRFYDPDQDPEERRAVRKGLRDLATRLNGTDPLFICGFRHLREPLTSLRFACRIPPSRILRNPRYHS